MPYCDMKKLASIIINALIKGINSWVKKSQLDAQFTSEKYNIPISTLLDDQISRPEESDLTSKSSRELGVQSLP